MSIRARSWLVVALSTLAPASAPATETADQFFEAGRRQLAAHDKTRPIRSRARNVILFVGDGMGVATVTAARIWAGQQVPGNRGGEEHVLSFESFPHLALSKTYQANQQVPDSAPTMTAIVTGVKTGEGMLSIAPNVAKGDAAAAARRENQLLTILERAERAGLATGVVSTARLTHATPAALYAHTPDRDWETDDAAFRERAGSSGFPDIARQLVEFPQASALDVAGDGLEVALGGGRAGFLPPGAGGLRLDERDLTAEWRAGRHRGGKPGAYVATSGELRGLDPTLAGPVLGLFDPSHMQYESERDRGEGGQPALAEMTGFAIDALSAHRKGYFLMVEGGRIDHGHHAGNAYRALTETVAFADAVRVAIERTKDKDTLIIVTADHSHVLTIGGYARRGNPILGLVAGNDETTGTVHDAPDRDLMGCPYTTLGYQNGPGYTGASLQGEVRLADVGPKVYPHFPDRYEAGGDGGRAACAGLAAIDVTAPTYLQRSAVPLASETHGGEDVAIYARGPKAYLVAGVMEQHATYQVMAAALGFEGRW